MLLIMSILEAMSGSFFFFGGGGWEGEHLGERERDDNKVFASFNGLINFRKKIYILLP